MSLAHNPPRLEPLMAEASAEGLLFNGDLSVKPSLDKLCTTFRVRGREGDFQPNEALRLLRERTREYQNATVHPRLRVGLMFAENIEKFFPVKIKESGSSYHFFHFMEMIAIAFSELHCISLGLRSDNFDTELPLSPVVSIPWIFSPYMSPTEICGGQQNLNCLAADFVLRSTATKPRFSRHEGIIGLKDMENYQFDVTNTHEKAVDRRLQLAKGAYGDGSGVTNGADAVLIVDRASCNHAGINKPWADYIDNFPAAAWHASVLQSLKTEPRWRREKSNGTIVVGYIDRQNTDRKLPDPHHEWIVQYLTLHQHVDFRHLHMEDYTGSEQIVIASQCDMLIGMHGNGLTHSLWMTPHRYLIEFFYGYNYQFDYATTGQLLHHSYLGILDGEVIDSDKVRRRDVSLRQHPTRKESRQKPKNLTSIHFEEQAKPAVQNFVELAIYELNDNR